MQSELALSDSSLDKLPPQSIEAEQAVLGALLVSGESISRVADIIKPEFFYRKAHQVIYAAMLDLFEKSEPIDTITVSQYLRDAGTLENIGGRQYLSDLAMAVATTANVEYYAKVVNEKSLVRNLIRAGTEIVASCYEDNDAAILMDNAERLIFNLAEHRDMKQLMHIRDIVEVSFARIEERYENRDSLSGTPSGFYDLDAMTSGFQKSDLIIVAARPSMGKCLAFDSEIVLADGSVDSIENIYNKQSAELLTLDENWKLGWTKPSCFVDDGMKPVFRVTTRLGRSIETTLTHPFLTAEGWKPLGEIQSGTQIAVPRRIPVFGTFWLSDDEISKLADETAHDRDVHPDVFRLERPLLALFLRKLFCTTEHSNPRFISYRERPAAQVQHLLLRFGIISQLEKRSYMDSGRFGFLWELAIINPTSFATFSQEVCTAGVTPELATSSQSLLPVGAGRLVRQNTHFPAAESHTHTIEPHRLESFTSHKKPPELVTTDVYWDDIISIEPMGLKQVYDLTVPKTHNFVANDICVHNTALALSFAQHAAVEMNIPVAIFSLEMSREQLVQRMLCSLAEIDATRLRSGYLQNNDWNRLAMAMGRLGEAPIFIDDSAVVTALDIRAKCRRLKAEQKELGLIMIDYIQLMQGRKVTDNRQQEVSEISRSLKTLARELECPVIALSQLSRAVESRQVKKPMLSDLRESGSIEQDADIVMFIYRDEYYNQESERRGEADIIIAKQRNGPVGEVQLLYQSSITRFLNKVHTGQGYSPA